MSNLSRNYSYPAYRLTIFVAVSSPAAAPEAPRLREETHCRLSDGCRAAPSFAN